MAKKPAHPHPPDEVTATRLKRAAPPPVSVSVSAETEIKLLRSALQQQGQMLSQLHEMMVALSQQVEAIKQHLGV